MNANESPAPSKSQQKWAASKKTRNEYATERRVALLAKLAPGGACAKCETVVGVENLEVDHVDGCTWNKRAKSAWTRVALYWKEFDAGIPLRALCRSCNGSDGTRRFRGRRRY